VTSPVADPDISFGGPRGAEVERRRREDRGAEGAEGGGVWGGGVRLPTGDGVWRGGYASSPENFAFFYLKKRRVLVDSDV